MTKGLEPWTPFGVRQFNGFKVVIDKVKEMSSFPTWCLKSHFPQFNVIITIDFLAIVLWDFTQKYGYGLEQFRVFVNRFVEFPPESTRTFPKFNVIFLVFNEKLPKFVKDDRCVNLI